MMGIRHATWVLALAVVLPLALAAGCSKSVPDPPTQTERTEFFAAIQDGDAEIVDRLLSAKPVLTNTRNDQGQTPLAVARQANNDELAAVIKRHGGKE